MIVKHQIAEEMRIDGYQKCRRCLIVTASAHLSECGLPLGDAYFDTVTKRFWPSGVLFADIEATATPCNWIQ